MRGSVFKSALLWKFALTLSVCGVESFSECDVKWMLIRRSKKKKKKSRMINIDLIPSCMHCVTPPASPWRSDPPPPPPPPPHPSSSSSSGSRAADERGERASMKGGVLAVKLTSRLFSSPAFFFFNPYPPHPLTCKALHLSFLMLLQQNLHLLLLLPCPWVGLRSFDGGWLRLQRPPLFPVFTPEGEP